MTVQRKVILARGRDLHRTRATRREFTGPSTTGGTTLSPRGSPGHYRRASGTHVERLCFENHGNSSLLGVCYARRVGGRRKDQPHFIALPGDGGKRKTLSRPSFDFDAYVRKHDSLVGLLVGAGNRHLDGGLRRILE